MVENFTNFPAVLKRKVVTYLDHCSAVRLANSCRTLHSDIPLSTLAPPYELIGSFIWHGENMTGDIPIKSVRIPILGIDPHTVRLTCRWKDQGWGNRKGKLFVVAQSTSSTKDGTDTSCLRGRDHMEDDETALFGGGRFVYKSPVPAAHEFEDLQIVLTPKEDEVYHLWVVVGGGGGHLLIVEDLFVHTLVLDDSDRNMRKAYASLYRHGVIDSSESSELSGGVDSNSRDVDGHFVRINHHDLVFYMKVLKHVLDLCSQSQSKENADNLAKPLSSFESLFQSRNLQIMDSSYLSAMMSICNFCFQFLNQDTTLSEPPILALDDEGEEVLLPPFSLKRYATLWGDADDSKPAPRCRIPFIVGRTKSVRLSCTWQEYGDSGTEKLYVIAKTGIPGRTDSNIQGEDPNSLGAESTLMTSPTPGFDRGRIVWESPVASHQKTSLDVTFPTIDTERYYLYQGSVEDRDLLGSISLVSLESLSVQLTIMDDHNNHFQQSYTQLVLNGGLVDDGDFFQTRLLLAAIEYLQWRDAVARDGTVIGLYQFFESNNLATDEGSLRSLRELVHALLDFKEEQKRASQGRMPDGVVSLEEERPFRMFSVM